MAWTTTSYEPAGVDGGTVMVRLPAAALPRSVAVPAIAAARGAGALATLNVIGSMRPGLRPTASGTVQAVPASPATSPSGGRVALGMKSPSGPRRETSRRMSGEPSGSVVVFQLRLPRYWSAHLTSDGGAAGRVAR